MLYSIVEKEAIPWPAYALLRMITRCIYIPREEYTEATAIVQTTYDINKGSLFDLLLKELHEGVSTEFSLEIVSYAQTVYMCFTTDPATSDVIVGGIYSVIPDAEIRQIKDFIPASVNGATVAAADLKLQKNTIYPLQAYVDLQFDSLSPLFSILSTLPPEDLAIIQIVCKPTIDSTFLHMDLNSRRVFERFLQRFNSKYWFKRGVLGDVRDKIDDKLTKPLYHVNIKVGVVYKDKQVASVGSRPEDPKEYLATLAGGYLALSTIDLNALKIANYKTGPTALRILRNREMKQNMLLTTTELASFWHPPDLSTLPNTAQVLFKKGPAPVSLPTTSADQDISFFGETNYRDQIVPFGIRRADRRRHLYIVGKSGVGKSCLLQLLAKNDLENGDGFAVLDPHGDLIDDILKLVPEKRISDVVILDPSDVNFPASFNPLAQVPEELRMRVGIGFVEIFKKLFGNSWNEPLEHLLRYTVLALLATDRATVLSIRKMLLDEKYRLMIADQVPDEVVQRFWYHDFKTWQERFHEQAISPLLDKVNQFVSTNMIRNIVGQPVNRFNFREIMDSKKILLMKVSKGILGDENASLLGAMVVARLYEAAMSRADLPPEKREDFYFYVDEFHNFATSTFKEILSESRKYGLNLTLANQYLGQLGEDIRGTIFGNVGNLISFSVGGEDAGVLANEFRPRFQEGDLMNLGFRDFYVRMSIDGETPEPFSGKTMQVKYPTSSYTEECLNYSRSNYAISTDKAEALFERWDSSGSEQRREQMVLIPGTDTLDLRPFLRRYGTILQLSYLDVTDRDLEQLGNRAFQNVKNLQLLSTAVTDKGLSYIHLLPNIMRLRLDDTHVTDEGVKKLNGIGNLQRLRLDDTEISDQSFVYLKHLPIRRLFVRNTRVTDAIFEHLEDFAHLREVAVRGTNVTQSAIKKFVAKNPHINIHY